MSEGSPNVYVTVDTHDVAAEVSRLKSDINHVANEIRDVSNNIHILQVELLAQMAVAIDRLNAVRNEVSRSIEAAAQAKIVETASEIFGKIGIITSSANRISQQFHKSVIRCGRISEKFDSLNDEVKTSYHTDIQRLGKNIFDLWYNHYQGVENRIQKQHTGFLTTIKRSVEQIREYREQSLEELLKSVTEKLDHFLEQRKNFHNSIAMITARRLSAPEDKIAIPMIIVKKKGVESAQIKIGHEVASKTHKHIRYDLKKTDIFRTYRSDHSNLDKYIRWRQMTHEELKQLEQNLRRLLEKKYFSKEYYQLLIRALKKNPPKVPEQFEMPRTGDHLAAEAIRLTQEEEEYLQTEIKLDEKNWTDEDESQSQEERES
jgi:hypothetical protein